MKKHSDRGDHAGVSSAQQTLLVDDQLCFALYSATHAIQGLYRPLLSDLGLTYPQYLVLLVLWERDGLPVSEIGDRLFLNSATLTPLLKRMGTAGLVERRRSTADERRVEVFLTDLGRDMRTSVREVTHEVTCAAQAASEQVAELIENITLLRDGLLNPL